MWLALTCVDYDILCLTKPRCAFPAAILDSCGSMCAPDVPEKTFKKNATCETQIESDRHRALPQAHHAAYASPETSTIRKSRLGSFL